MKKTQGGKTNKESMEEILTALEQHAQNKQLKI